MELIFNDLISKGDIAIELKKYKNALEIFKKALELNPNSIEAFFGLSKSYYFLGQFDESLFYINKCLEIEPINVHSLKVLGCILYYKNQPKEGKEVFEQVARLTPEDYHIWSLLAYFEQSYLSSNKNNQLDKTLSYASNALRLNPVHIFSRNQYVSILIKLNRKKEAEEFHKETLKISPNESEVLSIAGEIQLSKLNYQKAQNFFKSALIIYPNEPKALMGLNATSWKSRIITSLAITLPTSFAMIIAQFSNEILEWVKSLFD
jgi:tetratricopeptide (TPR) repeat protein